MLIIVPDDDTTQDERLSVMQAWLNDPRFGPGFQTLCDFSGATSTPTLPELVEIVDVIKQNANVIGRKRVAIVTSRPLIFGVARQFGALAPGSVLTVQIFKDRDTAFVWLNAPPE